jgi:phage-related tail protein
MAETAPETPEPTAPEGLGAHLRAWFERDILPRLSAVEGDVASLRSLGPQVAKLAGIVEQIAGAADPEAAPKIAALAADAGKVAAEIATIVTELGAVGA